MQFCRAHWTSSRWPVVTGGSPTRSRQSSGFTHQVAPQWCPSRASEGSVTTTVQASVGRLHRGLVCSISGCGEVPTPGCVVGTCETHCTHPQCSPPPLPPLPASTSRPHPNCSLVVWRNRSRSERVHPECSTRCTVPAASASSMLPRTENPMIDGPGIPTRSFQVAALDARRLWLRDQSVHDGSHMLSGIFFASGVDVCASRRCSQVISLVFQ